MAEAEGSENNDTVQQWLENIGVSEFLFTSILCFSFPVMHNNAGACQGATKYGRRHTPKLSVGNGCFARNRSGLFQIACEITDLYYRSGSWAANACANIIVITQSLSRVTHTHSSAPGEKYIVLNMLCMGCWGQDIHLSICCQYLWLSLSDT